MPLRVPDVADIAATDVLLLVHVPPASVLVSDVVWPWHTVGLPPMAEGSAYTVNGKLATQPADVVYLKSVVPADMPDTVPNIGSIDATPGFVLLHVPPVTTSLIVVALPWHIDDMPVIAASGLTVTLVDAVQPAVVV
jgi:hypothetical protein